MSFIVNKFFIFTISTLLFAVYTWVLFSVRNNPSILVVVLTDFMGIIIGYTSFVLLTKAYVLSGGYFKKIIFWEIMAVLIASLLLFTYSIFEFYFTNSNQYFLLISPIAFFGVCTSVMLACFWFCRITFSDIFTNRRLWLYGVLNTIFVLLLSTRFIDSALLEIYEIVFYGLSLMVSGTTLILLLHTLYESGRAYFRFICLQLFIASAIFLFLVIKVFFTDVSHVMINGGGIFQQAIEVMMITFAFLISINLYRLEVFSITQSVSKK
jgi:hypothetical protein